MVDRPRSFRTRDEPCRPRVRAMAGASTLDVSVFVLVLGLRLVVPLFIPRFPLPALLAALVIDGIDQTSFLLADDGRSNREKVYMWAEADLMAMRMYEYKVHFKIIKEHAQWLNIDMTTIESVGLAPWLFNLYIDPKEQYPVGHRMNAFLASMIDEAKGHHATFKKFPPKNIGLAQ